MAKAIDVATPPTTSPAPQLEESVDLRQSVGYLASDQLEGRGVDTNGINLAADYIAKTFNRLKLKPPPGADRFQAFNMTTARRPGAATALSAYTSAFVPWRVIHQVKTDFIPIGFSGEGKFEAPAVFVGYGISSAERKYDDYAGVDVKGKVAVALRYEPHDEKGVSRWTGKEGQWSPAAGLEVKAKAAADHGAVALVFVNPPNFHTGDALVPFNQMAQGRKVDLPFIQITQAAAAAWLKSAGAPELKEVQEKIDSSGQPASLPLPSLRIAGEVEIEKIERQVKNVMAALPGAGPHKDEWVVVGAHYDHLGRGGMGSLTPGSAEIHNGADDNASGTTAMLKLAEIFNRKEARDRSLLFVAFTAEEEGLIGSNRFVSEPPIPLDKIAYMLNLDMVGRVHDETLYVGGTGTAAGFEKLLQEADADSPLQLKNFGKGGFGPSDHMSFAKKHVPVLFLFSGMHADYHRPTDDADKVNYAGMQEVIDLATGVVEKLTTMPREAYVDANDHSSMGDSSRRGSRVTLGVVPDYAEEIKGLRITGTVPDSPAAKAGLKDGDVLVGWNDKPIKSIYDLTDYLADGKPGDSVTLRAMRGGAEVKLTAVLAARKE